MRNRKLMYILICSAAILIGGMIVWKATARNLITRLHHEEIRLGTAGKGNWLYHRVVEDPQGLVLNAPGFLLGFEKSEGSLVGAIRLEEMVGGKQGTAFDISVLEGTERKKLEKALDDDRRAFLSHIVHYSPNGNRMVPTLIYNAYDRDHLDEAKNAYQEGFRQLSGLVSVLVEAVNDENASHVVVMCMGWNTDQQEAIRNFNSILGNMLAAGKGVESFRPLVIGITWDSTWSSPFPKVLSYFHKANDADEVGAIWINWLLRKVLAPVKAELSGGNPRRDVDILLIGHSFGARVLSTALARHQILRDLPDGAVTPELISLFVALQPAFSVDRFNKSDGVSKEGAPLRDYRQLAKKFVLTWSENDMANPVAFWASHGGGTRGHESSIDSENADQIFEQVKWTGEGWADGEAPSGDASKVAMVNAGTSVRHRAHTKGGAAHSDIYHLGIGRLLWDLQIGFASRHGPRRTEIVPAADGEFLGPKRDDDD